MGKTNLFNDLSSEQVRQIVDLEQVFSAYRSARQEWNTQYQGTMSWRVASTGDEYLRRREGTVDKGLGRRNQETEAIKAAFDEAKARVKNKLQGTSATLDQMAPVNKALRIGRVPTTTAKVLRKLDEAGALGRNIIIVGTNALYAYEIRAGVQFSSESLSTGDIDCLFDARARMGLSVIDLKAEGIIGLLRRADKSFDVTRKGSYTAENSKGFMVDLIMPAPKSPMSRTRRVKFPQVEGDLEPIEIDGLSWLLNSPKFEAMAVGEDGYPLRIVTPDPRAFALHKYWLSNKVDRDPLKKKRDLLQSNIIMKIIEERFPLLRFDSEDMAYFPKQILEGALASKNAFDGRFPNMFEDFTSPRW
jgi:hypothetical protein